LFLVCVGQAQNLGSAVVVPITLHCAFTQDYKYYLSVIILLLKFIKKNQIK